MQPGDLSVILPEIVLSLFAMAGLVIGAYGGKDKLGQKVFPKVSGIMADKYKEVRVEDLARAMVCNAELNANRQGEETLDWEDFQRIWAMEKIQELESIW